MSITEGNRYYRDGNFLAAMEEYRKITADSPLFAHAKFNVERCLAHLTGEDAVLIRERGSVGHRQSPAVGDNRTVATESAIADLYRVRNEESWTAVVTLWRRGDYLREQLTAIANQTIPPKNIVIIQNESHLTINKEDFIGFNFSLIKSDLNSLYTRWIVGYLCDSAYVCVFDDDVIPGRQWIELCLRTSKKYNALVGPSGRRALPGGQPAWKSIETQDSGKDEFCDWVCNSYFFQTAWIKYIVVADRYLGSQKTYDDIQLATTLKAFGGIQTVVPGQPKKNRELNGHLKREYGHDEHALWKRQPTEHMLSRAQLIKQLDDANFEWCKVN